MNVSEYSWVNAKSTEKFFSEYSNWCEKIRNTPLKAEEIIELYSLLSQFDNVRNAQILKFKILSDARDLRGNILVDEYYEFQDKLRKEQFWLEKSFEAKPISRQNTFLAAQGFEFKKYSDDGLIHKLKSPITEERAKKKISRILQNVRTTLTGNTAFSTALDDVWQSQEHLFDKTSWLDAIADIHFEITDNIDHWMNYSENRRRFTHPENFFGETLILEIALQHLTGDNCQLEEIVPNIFHSRNSQFVNYLVSILKERQKSIGFKSKRGINLMEINYFDNGRGIKENFLNFGKEELEYTSLSEVIENQNSTRSLKKAGQGLSNIIRKCSDSGALFYLYSGDEIVFSNPSGEDNLNYLSDQPYFYGTHFSIILVI